jgi:hypothetical protein
LQASDKLFECPEQGLELVVCNILFQNWKFILLWCGKLTEFMSSLTQNNPEGKSKLLREEIVPTFLLQEKMMWMKEAMRICGEGFGLGRETDWEERNTHTHTHREREREGER